MNVLDHLVEEHRKVEALMASLAKTDPGSTRDRLVDELEEALATHMAVEEEFLYPIVAERIGSEDAEEAENEHELTRQGLATLREMADEPGFGAALEAVKGGISHHVEEEETDMFPELRKVAGDAIAAMDPEALEAVAGATREQLYERARVAGVAGRSKMSKSELADAVAEKTQGS